MFTITTASSPLWSEAIVYVAPTGAFGPLLRTVFEAIFEVFLMCFVGWLLARKRILDKRTQKQLNRVNVSVFTPCLLFSKVAFSLSPAKLRELWIIPLLFIFITSVSAIVAFSLSTLLRLRKTQRNFAMAASMFNNSNSLPIALMQSLVVTVPGLQWGRDDNKDAMLGRALGYLVLYSTLGMMLRWSYGVHLLAQSDEEMAATSNQTTVAQLVDVEETVPPDNLPSTSSSASSIFPLRPAFASPDIRPDQPSHPVLGSTLLNTSAQKGRLNPRIFSRRSQPKRFFSLSPNLPAQSTSPSPEASPRFHPKNPNRLLLTNPTRERLRDGRTRSKIILEDASGEDESEIDEAEREETDASNSEWGARAPQSSTERLPASASHRRPSLHHLSDFERPSESRIVVFLKTAWSSFTHFMTMPLYAALASIIVALVPPLQHTLNEHVQPVKGFLSSAGACSIPITLVVLGAYFHTEEHEGKEAEDEMVSTKPKIALSHANGGTHDLLGDDEDLDVQANSNAGRGDETGSAISSRSSSTSDIEANNTDCRSSSFHNLASSGRRLGKTPDSASQYTIVDGDGVMSQDTLLPLHHPHPQHHTSSLKEHQISLTLVPSRSTLAENLYDAFKIGGLKRKISTLSRSRRSSTAKGRLSEGDRIGPGESKTVFAALVSRMILTPIVVLPFVWLLVYFDMAHPIFDDPVFVCCTVLLISSPPALTIAQITQAASGDAFERLVSRTIFWAYCILTPPLTLVYVIVALHFSR